MSIDELCALPVETLAAKDCLLFLWATFPCCRRRCSLSGHGLYVQDGGLYQNAMQSAAFARFSDMNGNWNGLSVSDVFGDEEIKIGYTDGWLSTSQNMVKI